MTGFSNFESNLGHGLMGLRVAQGLWWVASSRAGPVCLVGVRSQTVHILAGGTQAVALPGAGVCWPCPGPSIG